MDRSKELPLWVRLLILLPTVGYWGAALWFQRVEFMLFAPVLLLGIAVIGLMIRWAYFIGRDPPPDPP